MELLGGEDGVFHAGGFGKTSPFLRVVSVRLEFDFQRFILFGGHLLVVAHPLAAGRDGVKPPVDKHTEASLSVPFYSFFVSSSVKHGISPFIAYILILS